MLEVLVATTIMGIAVVTLMSAMSTSVRNAARLTDYDRAALIARARMDALLADPAIPEDEVIAGPIDAEALGGAQGGWRAKITPFESAPNGLPALDRVQLEIWWMSGAERRSFPLEAFRRAVSRPGGPNP